MQREARHEPRITDLPPHALGLVRTIEGEVIPRLMLAMADPQTYAPPPLFSLQPTPEHVEDLTLLVLSSDEPNLAHYTSKLRAQGMSLSAIYLQLITQTARALGDQWIEDTLDFTEVTVGLGRLHNLVHQLSPAFRHGYDPEMRWPVKPSNLRRILVAPISGEQHTLGCAIVEEFFAKAGWHVSGWPLDEDADLVGLVGSDYFDVIGLSVSCEMRLDAAAVRIRAIRAASLNRELVVLVGGRVFSENPSLVRELGADLTADGGEDAVVAAEAAVLRRRPLSK